MALKMLYNVGWFRSGTVTGLLYLMSNEDTGKRYLAQPHDHDASDATAIKYLEFSKSVLETMIASGTAAFASAIPYSSIEESVPSSQKNVDGSIIVENLPTGIPEQNAYRSLVGDTIPFFSKKGVTVSDVPTVLTAVTSTNLQLWKSGLLGSTSTTAAAAVAATGGTTAPGTATTTSITGIAFIDSILMFFWNNPLLMAVGAFLLLEAFGVTNVLGLGKKKGRKRR